jgi:hypothetical protein
MEARFGHDFSQVRLHQDEVAATSSRQMGARAYTVGNAVVFGAGQYKPATSSGQRLLAHELTHVLQQRAGGADGVAVQRSPLDGLDDAHRRRGTADGLGHPPGDPLPFREATELAECIRIMKDPEYCRREVLGESSPADAPATPANEPAKKTEFAEDAADKQVTIQPESKIEGEEARKIEMEASIGASLETKKEDGKRQTEGDGELAFELTFPLFKQPQKRSFSLFKEGSTELNLGPGRVGGGAAIDMVKQEFPKVKSLLKLDELSVSGKTTASGDFQIHDRSAAYGVGVSAEAEAKIRPIKKYEPLFLKVNGAIVKTYGKEGEQSWRWRPVTFSVGLSVGVTIP